ncbi:unnamed protein product [Notodromas monacha]|uniref:GH18 domain-containing protein n=1 Tax=Notodromas monacha TaxID=399045 RepID=A0A7R9G7R3_9CRUS|nr:unnamed protein product [Notodromas monacha]CAG0912515.1 unnamed protein product [Notodromas monacha]
MKAVVLLCAVCVAAVAGGFLGGSVAEKAEDKVFVCYFGSWAKYRPGLGKFDVENIDPYLCTHIIYGFAGLKENQIAALDPYNDLVEEWGLGAFKKFVNLKKYNPKLKALIAIGGWNEGSQKYSSMAGSPQTRSMFVDSVLKFLEHHKFDGLDMDWEYPAFREGAPEDKENFISLLAELRAAFRPHNYLLTAAVSAGKVTIDGAYNVPRVAE